jgi:spermidine synthase
MEKSAAVTNEARRVYWDILAAVYPDHPPLDILEIGVYKGGLARVLDDRVNVHSYTGVDPYVGSLADSYFHIYWKNQNDADVIYRDTKTLFDSKGYTLVRDSSAAYWQKCAQTYDVIIVDGDHSLAIALWDMHHWFKRLNPNGLLMIDDYDNPQTPEVTKAATRFLHMDQSAISRVGYKHFEFVNTDLEVPIGMSVVYAQHVPAACDAARVQDFPARLTFPELSLKLAKNMYRLGRRSTHGGLPA